MLRTILSLVIFVIPTWLKVAWVDSAAAQQPAPPPAPFVAESDEWKPLAPGTGHPFWTTDRARPTLLAERVDEQVRAVSFEQPPPAEPPSPDIVRWADAALLQLDGLRDYTCTFIKREEINGRLQEQQVMFTKARLQPFSVYLQFLAPSDVRGQEAIYVAGANNGKLLAHPVGFKQALVGTVAIAPNDPQAVANDRYMITDFGIRRLIERLRETAVREAPLGDCEVRRIEHARVADRPCTCLQTTHASQRPEFRFHITRLYIDEELNLPIRFEAYAWPRRAGESPPLVEEYTYQGLKLNVGLRDVDFDIKNTDYRF